MRLRKDLETMQPRATDARTDRLQKMLAIVCFAIAAGLLAMLALRPEAARAGVGTAPLTATQVR
jgi:hypothetical protein